LLANAVLRAAAGRGAGQRGSGLYTEKSCSAKRLFGAL